MSLSHAVQAASITSQAPVLLSSQTTTTPGTQWPAEIAPVSAKVDRVWHAIPGLYGWRCDQAATLKVSAAHGGARVPIVWQAMPPAVRLRDLPPEPIYRGPGQEKAVALMVNVSWGEVFVPKMLNTFKKTHVHATFFLDGQWVKAHPDLVKRMVQEGHDIGSHGSGHPDFSKLSNEKIDAQLTRSNAVIQQVTGIRPILFAPPAGAFDKRTVMSAHRLGMYTILWTTDTVDWKRPPATEIVSRVMTKVEPGALVLMHPTEPTVAALPQIIAGLQKRGYQFHTVADVVAERPVNSAPRRLSP